MTAAPEGPAAGGARKSRARSRLDCVPDHLIGLVVAQPRVGHGFGSCSRLRRRSSGGPWSGAVAASWSRVRSGAMSA
jgi:hypothetical protein